jgi:chemotaxis protein CheD
MTNASAPLTAIHLSPGDWRTARNGERLVTVLGSCVAVCLWDPRLRIAGMNHFMLPGDPTAGTIYEDAKFGVHSMELLITALQKLGTQREHLEAKLFGGGAVLESVSSANVGTRNAEFALEYLEREGIPVVAQDLYGRHARKIVYDTAANRVHVKYLKAPLRLMAAEIDFQAQHKPPVGTVELF